MESGVKYLQLGKEKRKKLMATDVQTSKDLTKDICVYVVF
jgi:hypothetical protein